MEKIIKNLEQKKNILFGKMGLLHICNILSSGNKTKGSYNVNLHEIFLNNS